MGPRLRNQTGTVTVEFALLAPLFFALVFLVTDFGRFFNYLNDANQIAAVGARMAAVDTYPGASELRAQGDTTEMRLGGTGLPGGMNYCVKYTKAEVGQPVTVKADGSFKLVPLLGGLSIPVHAEATMRLERIPSFSTDCTS